MGQLISNSPGTTLDTPIQPRSPTPPTPPEPKTVEVNYEEASSRFSVQNLEELKQGIEHLDEHGYAVFSNVLSADQVTESTDLLWKFLENLEEPYNIRRDDPKSWDKRWPGMQDIGLLNQFDIGQSEYLWSIRGNPNVKKVFAQIWNSNELCVSFDGAGCFRNWHLNPKWKTVGGWYHCDQNPSTKPDRCSIQGLVSLTDSDESTGGLVVVPDSHKHFLKLQSTTHRARLGGDFVNVPVQHPLFKKLTPRLVKCRAGDLVVWDSRCVHCNTAALIDKEPPNKPALLRLVAYVCMSPISMFTPVPHAYETIEEYRQFRERYVREGVTCTHWPLELVAGSRRIGDSDRPLELNAYQHSLVIGTNVEPDNK